MRNRMRQVSSSLEPLTTEHTKQLLLHKAFTGALPHWRSAQGAHPHPGPVRDRSSDDSDGPVGGPSATSQVVPLQPLQRLITDSEYSKR
jgi:hypothetical protein